MRMMQILLVILYSLILIFLVAVIVIAIMYEFSLLATKAPFISIPRAVVPMIVDVLELKEGSVCYDLGCGEGRVLFGCEAKVPGVKYIGIDKARVAIWQAKLNAWRKKSKIIFIKDDFFKHDLSAATHVFVYLFPGLMNDLLPKLEKELKPGTRLVSCDFVFEKKQPVQTIELHRPKGLLGQKLVVYKF